MTGASIRVFPDALAAAAGELEGAAGDGQALRGNFSHAAVGAGGCGPEAAGAFQQMQDALAGSLAALNADVGRYGPKTAWAGEAYVATDRSAMPGGAS